MQHQYRHSCYQDTELFTRYAYRALGILNMNQLLKTQLLVPTMMVVKATVIAMGLVTFTRM